MKRLVKLLRNSSHEAEAQLGGLMAAKDAGSSSVLVDFEVLRRLVLQDGASG